MGGGAEIENKFFLTVYCIYITFISKLMIFYQKIYLRFQGEPMTRIMPRINIRLKLDMVDLYFFHYF